MDRVYFSLSEDTQKRYKLLSQRVAQRAMMKNVRYTPEQFVVSLKDSQIENARFVFWGVHYEIIDGWMLIWKKDGEDDEFIFDSDEEIISAPLFDGKTLVEISEQLTEIRVDLAPNRQCNMVINQKTEQAAVTPERVRRCGDSHSTWFLWGAGHKTTRLIICLHTILDLADILM